MPDENIKGPVLPLQERLALVYERLDRLPPAEDAYQAFEELAKALEEVENLHSGVDKVDNPGLNTGGRMYPPREDHINRFDDGSMRATTKGNIIEISPGGTTDIFSRRESRKLVYHRPGADLVGQLDPQLSEMQRLREGDYPVGLESPTATTPDTQAKPAAGHGNAERDDRTHDR